MSDKTNYKTNYEKVCEFNSAFDVSRYNCDINELFKSILSNSTDLDDTYIQNKKIFNLRCNLVIEEATELQDGFNKNSRGEMRDAICDLLYVLYGIGYTYNFDMNNIENFNIYYNDNLMNPEKILQTSYDLKKCSSFEMFKNIVIELTKIVYDYGIFLNFDVNSDFDVVHLSNMSKLCDDEQTAIDTVESYIHRYNQDPVKTPYDSPYYYKINLNGIDKYVIKNKSTGKVLKSIKYFEVEFN
jgi:predicted HAD superfamily Cof-like phosphohydrolase